MDDEKKNIKAQISKDFLKQIVYWTVCKYNIDNFTQEQSSSKRDLIGGFIDRWMNRAPEFLIFKELLKDKKYDVINDTFFYSDKKAKNAPDILGLKDENNNRYPFVEFIDEEWKNLENMPLLELKSSRSSQNLITIPENQFNNEKYYVIVESYLTEDYLLHLFEEDFFDTEEYEKIIQSQFEDLFIKSNNKNIIETPNKIKLSDDLGYYQLIGIYKGKNLKQYGKKITTKSKLIYYYQETDSPNTGKNYEVNPPLNIESGFYFFDNDSKNIPCYIDIGENSSIEITHKIKNAINVNVNGNIKVDGMKLSEGPRRLEFKEFDKNGDFTEFAITKSMLKYFDSEISSLDELIEEFDYIVGNNEN